MRIIIKTKIKADPKKVFQSLDKNLFMYLLPPGAKLIRFDGSRPGNMVHLRFGFPLYSDWVSEITELKEDVNKYYFIDEGRKLPLGMKHWRHKHLVRNVVNKAILEDRMEYSFGNKLIDLLAYPFLFFAFFPRKWQYKTYFSKNPDN